MQDSELKDKRRRKRKKRRKKGEGEEEERESEPETLIKDILASTSSESFDILKWKLKKKLGVGITTLDKKSSNNEIIVNSDNSSSKNCLVPLRSFAYSELRAATRNFRPDSLLGEGGFGCVFKGWVDEEQGFMAARPGTVIAVKKLNLEGLQGHKEWLVSKTNAP